MLSADGYDLKIRDESTDSITVEIMAGPDACADCLVPKEIMRSHFESTLRAYLGTEPPTVSLIYPADSP